MSTLDVWSFLVMGGIIFFLYAVSLKNLAVMYILSKNESREENQCKEQARIQYLNLEKSRTRSLAPP